jgi:hypothetical protein
LARRFALERQDKAAIAAIAASLPENLQLILSDYLNRRSTAAWMIH